MTAAASRGGAGRSGEVEVPLDQLEFEQHRISAPAGNELDPGVERIAETARRSRRAPCFRVAAARRGRNETAAPGAPEGQGTGRVVPRTRPDQRLGRPIRAPWAARRIARLAHARPQAGPPPARPRPTCLRCSRVRAQDDVANPHGDQTGAAGSAPRSRLWQPPARSPTQSRATTRLRGRVNSHAEAPAKTRHISPALSQTRAALRPRALPPARITPHSAGHPNPVAIGHLGPVRRDS